MAGIIRGADVRDGLFQKIKKETKDLAKPPRLGIVRVGKSAPDLAYERGILKTCSSCNIEAEVFALDAAISRASFEKELAKINEDSGIHGILLFRPLPEQLFAAAPEKIIGPEKDMDCMSPLNWGKLAMGDADGYYPCTAEAIMKICDYAGVDVKGKNVVIFGVSLVVGRPLGLMMAAKGASVTWIRSTTKDVEAKCKNADILVGCCGVAGRIGKDIARQVNPECVAIDAGINFKDGKMCGDFIFDEVEPFVSKITPVPGGVGAVTNAVLAVHVARAAIKAQTGRTVLL